MGKRQERELRRLEEALLESDYMNEVPDFWDEPVQESDSDDYSIYNDYEVYNTDDADVDLEEYSEEVHKGSTGSVLSVVLTMLAMVMLSAGILLFLKILGVL